MPARIFLYVIAILIALLLLAGIVWSLFQRQLMEAALVPSTAFVAPETVAANQYDNADWWYAQPGMAGANPGEWLPKDHVAATGARPAAVFYIHPTTYLDRAHWNAPITDKEAADRAILFVKGQASPFNAIADIWAPKYRQATFGAFLTSGAATDQAINVAYADVAAAFARFLQQVPAERPIILAGHSQGTLHLLRLIREQVAGKPVARRVIAAYAIGWPISVAHDLPALGFPACTTPTQTGCMIGWQSFADPADPSYVTETYDKSTGFDGQPRKNSPMLCTNPLTFGATPAAPASANIGTLITDGDLANGHLEPGKIPARCDDRGFLLIGTPPEHFNDYILPGNNYHVFDYSLFWANLRVDAVTRTNAFAQAR